MYHTFSNTHFYLQSIFLSFQVKLDFNIFYELLGQNSLVIVLNLIIKFRLLLKNLKFYAESFILKM
jgi:hypothetical protein